MKGERKAFELTEFKLDAGTGEFEGYASVFGNVDAGNDIVLPGAFDKALPAFLQDGFISWSHDWGQPVAFPTKAVPDEHGLLIGGKFHSTSAAQEARTLVKERAAAGKRVGLSIGYAVEEETKIGTARGLKTINPLFEVGFVMVPMNREANMTSAKGWLLDGTSSASATVSVGSENINITWPGSGSGSGGSILVPSPQADPAKGTIAEAVERILVDAEALVKRFATMGEQRKQEGRFLSAENRKRIDIMVEALRHLQEARPMAKELDALIEEARFLGVNVDRTEDDEEHEDE